jgi:hypothetical protein
MSGRRHSLLDWSVASQFVAKQQDKLLTYCWFEHRHLMSRSEQAVWVLVEFERHICAHCGTVPRPVVVFCRGSRKAVARDVESRKQLNPKTFIAAARCGILFSNKTRDASEGEEERKEGCAEVKQQRKTQGEGCWGSASNDVAGRQRPFPVTLLEGDGHSSGIQDDEACTWW